MRIFRAVAFFLLSSLIFVSSQQLKQDSNNGLITVCSSNTDCEATEFCNKEYCYSKEGVCSPRGDFCTEEIDPICGCDGKSYPNACKAMLEGVDLAKKGECTGEALTGTCKTNAECDDDDFCFFENCEDESGTCTARGGVCPAVYDPVCGCDRKTYSNRCVAFNSGASVNNKGACDNTKPTEKNSSDDDKGYTDDDSDDDDANTTAAPTSDGSIDDDDDQPCESTQDCGDTQFCNKQTCNSPTGICVERTNTICTADWKPVCGCDGKTYPNECVALTEGILLKGNGACNTSASAGGVDSDGDGEIDIPCAKNGDCADGYFCNRQSCAAESGICSSKDVMCTMDFKPVCACNGQTFPNACSARRAGAIVASVGACQKTGSMNMVQNDTDSCKTTADCDAGEYCKMSQCGATSGSGKCSAKPAFCAQLFSPVCDCSGKTHPNECHAASAGANVMHVGECKTEEKDAVCSSNVDCDDDEYCKKEACSVAKGYCVERGFASFCAMEYKPVCGCDGKTHSNPCRIAQAGVNINYIGECSKKNSSSPTPTASRGTSPAPTSTPSRPTPTPDDDDDDDDDVNTNRLICSDDAECPADDDFCYKETCNAPQGVCTKNTEIVCTSVIQPVCGCDGKTYSHGCKALTAGVNVDHQGSCDNGETECDGNEDCKKAEFCSKKGCSASATGKCMLKPQYCPALFAPDPVCGCDGITHTSTCHAQSVGVNVNYKGECNYTGQAARSKCFENDDCQKGYRCVKPSCDGQGECRIKSAGQMCIALYKPVCGCDGKTYSNSCHATVAGANIAFSGACKKNLKKLKRRK